MKITKFVNRWKCIPYVYYNMESTNIYSLKQKEKLAEKTISTIEQRKHQTYLPIKTTSPTLSSAIRVLVQY